jgi:hypothetical protein
LRKVEQPRQTNNRAVDFPECLDAKNFSAIVRNNGIVEGAVSDEEDNVEVRGGVGVFDEPEDADSGGDGDENGEDGESAQRV